MADVDSLYPFEPSHVLPFVFMGIVGVSLGIHIWQCFHYKFWRVMFFMCWGGAVFTAGWMMRGVSSYNVTNQNIYISQYVLVLCGPPIFAAAEYNVLGRLLQYLPMHTPVNPRRVMYFFIYLGALVEGLTAAGGAQMATSGDNQDRLKNGAMLVAIASVIQIAIECLFISMIALVHRRVVRSKMLTPNVRNICIVLYGTSTLILLRSIYRSVEKFSIYNTLNSGECSGACSTVLRHEWYIYAFEAAPMVLYTWWLNIMHPGRYLPAKPDVYLGFDKVERQGPGWLDNRPKWITFLDPFDWGSFGSNKNHENFWERQDQHPVVEKTGRANERKVAEVQKHASESSGQAAA